VACDDAVTTTLHDLKSLIFFVQVVKDYEPFLLSMA
jgi:hypothetical protein